jgi:hypothetical protein
VREAASGKYLRKWSGAVLAKGGGGKLPLAECLTTSLPRDSDFTSLAESQIGGWQKVIEGPRDEGGQPLVDQAHAVIYTTNRWLAAFHSSSSLHSPNCVSWTILPPIVEFMALEKAKDAHSGYPDWAFGQIVHAFWNMWE